MSNLEIVRAYLAALEAGAVDAALALLHEDVVYEELPNLVVPKGARSDREKMRAASERGAKVITGQRFEILGALAEGDRVALEVAWSGTLLVAYGALKPGDVMRARCAFFFELRDGRIVRQRNYDCYEPF